MKPAPTHPHLRALLSDAEATRAEAERLRDMLSDDQLTWKSAPDVWSVADCFEHLRKTDAGYCQRLGGAIGRMKPGSAPYRPSWLGRKYVYFVSPESRLKLWAPKSMRPQHGGSPSAEADALSRFLEQQAVLLGLIRRADERDLNTGRFRSPFAAVMKLSVGEGLTLLVRHEQRHLGQALRLTERAGFPGR